MFSKVFKNILNKTSMHNVLQPQNSVNMSKKYEVLQYDEEVLPKTLLLKLKFNRVLIVCPLPFFSAEGGLRLQPNFQKWGALQDFNF